MLKTAQILDTRLARSFFNTAAEQSAPVYHDAFGNMYFFDRVVKGRAGDEWIDVPPMVKLLVDGIDEEDQSKTEPVEGVDRTVLLHHYHTREYPSIFNEIRATGKPYFVRAERLRLGNGVKFKRFYVLDSSGKALLEVVQDVGIPA